jgi:hypothetical protein
MKDRDGSHGSPRDGRRGAGAGGRGRQRHDRRRPRRLVDIAFVAYGLAVLVAQASLRAITSRIRHRKMVGVAAAAGVLLAVLVGALYLVGESEIRPLAAHGGGQTEAESPKKADRPPESTEANLAKEGSKPAARESGEPDLLLGEYKTDFLWDSNPSRKANMELAAEAVDETVLKPGEVFSFNELTSPLDYEAAKTFSDGGVGYDEGGGLCQVSSTLYMAAQYAGLEIVERNAHYAVLPYIRPGFDATVWFGGDGIPALDMKFKNTTGGDILVKEFVDEEGFLIAQILGEEPTGLEVEMRSEKIFEDPNVGIKWITYKKVVEDGKVLYDGVLHEDLYGYNPPAPEGIPHYDTTAPRVAGWPDPTNTTGWADVE